MVIGNKRRDWVSTLMFTFMERIGRSSLETGSNVKAASVERETRGFGFESKPE